MRGKKAQTALAVAAMLFVFGLIWITGLSRWIAETGHEQVEVNNLSGFEGFFFSNMNLFIGLFYIIAWVAVARFGFA